MFTVTGANLSGIKRKRFAVEKYSSFVKTQFLLCLMKKQTSLNIVRKLQNFIKPLTGKIENHKPQGGYEFL